MANKNITMQQKNNAGSYDKLYPKTTATQSKLSAATAALYGDGVTDADAAMRIVANTIKDLGFVTVIVKDPSGNPIQGAIITGIQGTPATDANGKASGTLQSATITVNSPYVDLQSQTISVSSSFSSINVTLPVVGENAIKRFTSSQSVKFSNMIKTVDVCCVGGGGGGGKSAIFYIPGSNSYAGVLHAPGGGGGGIVNAFAISPQKQQEHNIIVGSGGSKGRSPSFYISKDYSGGNGGNSSFLGVSANGGGGGYVELYQTDGNTRYASSAGTEGSSGSGTGGNNATSGSDNTTLSELNDGVTFYSGGGGSGRGMYPYEANGGSPNGATGAWIVVNISVDKKDATSARIGGGGGGGAYDRDSYGNTGSAEPSAGGSGLVVIRFHF